jgi:tetratricopeptide (TPR) repeat protein
LLIYFQIEDVVTNSDILLEKIEIKFQEKNNDGESFLKFDRLTIVVWYLQCIQLIIKINKENNDRQPLINYLKDYYSKDRKRLEDILKFEREYSPLTAINWYTKDSFVYRTLNKAFRSFDMEVLILYRFFIADLYEQLDNLYKENNTSAETIYYRGQLMHKSEIEALKKDQCLCSTSFLSTTRNRHLALSVFAGAFDSHALTEENQPVLFLIRQSSLIYKRLTYADITNFSDFGRGEEEVLFGVGSYFRIHHIWFDDNFWHIELTEHYVEHKIYDHIRPFYIDIITIGFYLFVKDDDFQSIQKYYEVLLKEANSSVWIVSCQVGFGLIEYYKNNYQLALEKFEDVVKFIDEEALSKTCDIIGNIYCILANVYREMNNYQMALHFYKKAMKINIKHYFIEEQDCFWDMYIYKTKINPFIKDDKYFYYCDRILLNLSIFYKINQQWDLAMTTFQRALNNYFGSNMTDEVEMFMKILGHNQQNNNMSDLINQNREFLGGKTLSKFSNENHKRYVIFAYLQLGNHCLRYICPDHALIYFQEIYQIELKLGIDDNFKCWYGIGSAYELKQEYIQAVTYFERAINLCMADILNDQDKMFSFPKECYEKFLSIFNEKLNDTLSPINYVTEIINNLLRNINDSDKICDIIAIIYKITVHFYHNYDKTKMKSIFDHIHEVIDKIKINDQSWKKWLCIGSTCTLEKFEDNYHHCNPILDDNYNIYLKLYNKIFDLLSNDTSDKLKTEIHQCEGFRRHLRILKLDRAIFIHRCWSLSNQQTAPRPRLTRSSSQ